MLSDISDVGGDAISAIQTLKKLNLGGQLFQGQRPIIAIAKDCINLEVLNLCRSLVITRNGIHAFFGHKCLQSLDIAGCWSAQFSGSDLENLALTCPSLKSIVVQES
ncbi:hypothetical protein ACLB2K_046929 [Fragaria x ananassa]